MWRTSFRPFVRRGSPEAGQLVAHLLLPLTDQVSFLYSLQTGLGTPQDLICIFFVRPLDGAWDPLSSHVPSVGGRLQRLLQLPEKSFLEESAPVLLKFFCIAVFTFVMVSSVRDLVLVSLVEDFAMVSSVWRLVMVSLLENFAMVSSVRNLVMVYLVESFAMISSVGD